MICAEKDCKQLQFAECDFEYFNISFDFSLKLSKDGPGFIISHSGYSICKGHNILFCALLRITYTFIHYLHNKYHFQRQNFGKETIITCQSSIHMNNKKRDSE